MLNKNVLKDWMDGWKACMKNGWESALDYEVRTGQQPSQPSNAKLGLKTREGARI